MHTLNQTGFILTFHRWSVPWQWLLEVLLCSILLQLLLGASLLNPYIAPDFVLHSLLLCGFLPVQSCLPFLVPFPALPTLGFVGPACRCKVSVRKLGAACKLAAEQDTYACFHLRQHSTTTGTCHKLEGQLSAFQWKPDHASKLQLLG